MKCQPGTRGTTLKAALFIGGWKGHEPYEFGNWCSELLSAEGFEIKTFNSLTPLATPDNLCDIDLIIPIWSSARSSHQPEFGNMTKSEELGLIKLIANGCGLAGWHGHMGDAFRDLIEALLVVGRDREDVTHIAKGDLFPQVDTHFVVVRGVKR